MLAQWHVQSTSSLSHTLTHIHTQQIRAIVRAIHSTYWHFSRDLDLLCNLRCFMGEKVCWKRSAIVLSFSQIYFENFHKLLCSYIYIFPFLSFHTSLKVVISGKSWSRSANKRIYIWIIASGKVFVWSRRCSIVKRLKVCNMCMNELITTKMENGIWFEIYNS